MATREHSCAVLMIAALLSACAAREPTLPPPAPASSPFVETGTASWYGRWHRGRRTASGERFNPNAMTAAHRSLPLGTVVRVTNLENHRFVRVRINDRGPYVDGRIIDLSAAAARRLGMEKDGIARVRIEVVGP